MILHSFKTKILNVRYQEILKKIIENDPPSKETMNILDELGLTPFLTFVEYFCSYVNNLRGNLHILVIAESKKHKDDVSKYKIDNSSLFKPLPQIYTDNMGVRRSGAPRAPRK
jgi:hypothetical protein